MNAESFPLIDLAGAPHARGRAYGAAVPERVARSVALYRGQIHTGRYESYRKLHQGQPFEGE